MLKKIASIEEKLIPAWHYPVTILDLLNARGIRITGQFFVSGR